jgi:uncharacterized membrane protein (UPF0127 family)
MQTPIDVVFLDPKNAVMRLCPEVRAWRWAVVCRGAASVVELGPGALSEVDIMLGDQLELVA